MARRKIFFAKEKIATLRPEEERKLLQMAKEKVRVVVGGDSNYAVGEIIDLQQAERTNKSLIAAEGKPLEWKKVLQNERQRARAILLLIRYNQHLVRYIARGYYSKAVGVDYEDLVAEGIMSLTKAIAMFDLSSTHRFATYAGYWIHQKIQAFFAKNQLISQGPSVKERKNIVYYDDENHQTDNDNQTYALIDRLTDEDGVQLTNRRIRSQDTQKQLSNLINSLPLREEILITRLYYQIKPRNLIDIYHLAEENEKKILEKELEKIIKKEKKMAKIEIEEISKEPGIIELISGKQEEKWIKLIKLDELERKVEGLAKIEVEGGLDEEKTKKIKEKKSKWEASKEKISQEIKKDQSLAIVKKYLDLFKFKQRYTILELARLINKPESLVSKLKKNSFEKLQTAARERNLHSLLE